MMSLPDLTKSPLFIIVGGTGDGVGKNGMLGAIELEVDKRDHGLNVEFHYLEYPARYGDGMAYFDSRNTGIASLIDLLLTEAPTGRPIFLSGYSQGAAIVALALKLVARNLKTVHVLSNIQRVYLVANPHRQPGHIEGFDPGGRGISWSADDGWWGDFKPKVWEFCAVGDIIASSDPDRTLLTRLPDYTGDLNFPDPGTWAKAMRRGISTMNVKKMFPNVPFPQALASYVARWPATYKALDYYINSGIHTKYRGFKLPSGQLMFDSIVDDLEYMA